MPLILQNAPDVEFREIARLFVASFERPSAVAATGPETGLENTKKTPKKHQETILQHLRQHPQANVQELMGATGLSANGVKYHLNQLKQTGKLRRLGPTKGGRWEVTEPDSKGKT
jgi:ATP-dependent DNA helicase RecG